MDQLAEMPVEGESVECLVHVPFGNGQVPDHGDQHGRLERAAKAATFALRNVLDHHHAGVKVGVGECEGVGEGVRKVWEGVERWEVVRKVWV